MKTRLCALLFGALSLSAVMSIGSAADAQPRLPPGSYLRTCKNAHIHRGALHAECQDRRGRYRNTFLHDPFRCRGDIENRNGELHCSGHGHGHGHHH